MDSKPANFLKTLTVIHMALLASLIGFALFVYSSNGGFQAGMDSEDPFIYIVPVAAAIGYFLSQYLFKKQLSTITREEALNFKLSRYQSASIQKYALLEGPALMALFAYSSSGNALHLVIVLLLVAYLFAQRPTAAKLIDQLPLTREEENQFKL
ncbi:hypothetical protein [Pseudozobellia thermophila]|uniref:Uncharacterized protein n=1 Tax=Pseudozobellia thermophila TaxID=192903 RepID=A0A1M6F1G5_9FLAO|nr:hypothetical protein [Pseudozobellia thermophila]SHI91523.1 hypothetical protein SAMN04488513_102261 [Pseudozobellia thermophila]